MRLVHWLGAVNALLHVHVSPRGRVEDVRAKRVLFPVYEESFLGVGNEGDRASSLHGGRTIDRATRLRRDPDARARHRRRAQGIGHQGCVANGRCEGGGGCDRTCEAFTGLFCDGAPEETPTGCGAQRVHGWAVQKLAHKGWDDDLCADCAECDFTVEGRPRAD